MKTNASYLTFVAVAILAVAGALRAAETTLQFSAAQFETSEVWGSINVDLLRTPPLDTDVTFRIRVTGGTATFGVDYGYPGDPNTRTNSTIYWREQTQFSIWLYPVRQKN